MTNDAKKLIQLSRLFDQAEAMITEKSSWKQAWTNVFGLDLVAQIQRAGLKFEYTGINGTYREEVLHFMEAIRQFRKDNLPPAEILTRLAAYR